MMSVVWNPWHGCEKISPGCDNCYVYRIDRRHGRDTLPPKKTAAFSLPLMRDRLGAYKIPPGETVYTCFTSDFLLREADAWRDEAFHMMRIRSDLQFMFITKRIDRLLECLPPDWGDGYENVQIGCTMENQKMAGYRLPLFYQAPIRKKTIICEPLLEELDLSPYFGPWVYSLIAGGESGEKARPCDWRWILSLRRQCIEHRVPFVFKQTGAKLYKGGRLYHIPRKEQHRQARAAGIDFIPLERR